MYDLHFHTTLSDGTDSSQKMVDTAIIRGARLMACTEHDIVNREVGELVRAFNTKVQDRVFRKPPHIDVVEGAEVSVGHIDGDYQKSLHVTTYTREFAPEYDDFLSGIREGKSEKINLQCQTLLSHGFQIRLTSGVLAPFSRENVLSRFPEAKPDSLNNGHIKELFVEVSENLEILDRLIGSEVDASSFLRDCLKREGKYTRVISMPHEVARYEPTFEALIGQLDMENTVVSLPHANVTFRTIAEFQDRVGKLVDLGLNALEINVQAPREWVEAILETRKKYGLLLTFGSDSHGVGKVDRYHGEFMMLNQHIAQYPHIVAGWVEEFLLKTYGARYRSMMSGDFS